MILNPLGASDEDCMGMGAWLVCWLPYESHVIEIVEFRPRTWDDQGLSCFLICYVIFSS